MMEITLSGEVLSKLSGKNIDDLKELLQDEEGELKEDAQKIFVETVVTKFKDSEKTAKEQQYNRGIREKGQAIEKALKPLFDKHKIDASTAEEGITELAEKLKQAKPSTDDPATLDKDKLRKLPAFQEILNEELSVKDQKIEELQEQYNSYVSNIQTRELTNSVKSEALKILEKNKARFSGDTTDAKAGDIDFHLKAIGIDRFKVDGDEIIPVDQDGNQLRDDAKNLVSFDEYIKSNWRLGFDNVDSSRSFSGARKSGEGSGSSYKFTSYEDYDRMMKEAGTDRKKRAEITQAYAEYKKEQEEN
jgi:hypothetical protein